MYSNIREKLRGAFSGQNEELEIMDERVEPIIMYHGSSSAFLPKIMSYGLSANPKNKSYGSGSRAGDETLDSVGGVYFTTEIHVAERAADDASEAYKGNPIIVMSEIVQKSGHADEDKIRDILAQGFEDARSKKLPAGSDWHDKGCIDGNPKIVDSIVKNFADECHNNEHLAGDNDKHPIDYALFKEYFIAKFNSVLYASKNDENSVDDYYKGLLKTNKKAAQDFYNTKYKEWKKQGIPFPDIQEIDNRFRSALDRFTRRYRRTTNKDTGFDGHSLRITDDVRFSGRNKIVCIIEMLTTRAGYTKLKIRYGTIPEKFREDWESENGELKIVSDKPKIAAESSLDEDTMGKLRGAFTGQNEDLELLDERVAPVIMYHGTSSTFLKKILSYGLSANPKNKGYGSEIQGSYNQENMDSVGGVYFTNSIGTASTAAHSTSRKYGGHSIFIVAEIVQKSAHADEDNIRYTLSSNFDGVMRQNLGGCSWWKMRGMLDGKPELADNIIKDFAEKCHEELAKDTDKHPLDIALFKQYFEVKLNSLLYHTKDWQQSIGDYAEGLGRVNREAANTFYDTDYKVWKEKGIPFNDIKTIDAEFKQVLDKLSRRYRKTTTSNAFQSSLRVTDDVDFSGRNKIIAIAELIKHQQVGEHLSFETLKVVYGELPEKFKEDWREFQGSVRIIDKNYNKVAESSLDTATINKIQEAFGAKDTNDPR